MTSRNGMHNLAAVFVLLSISIWACDLSLPRTIAGSIDTSPTDCSQATFEVTMFADVNDGACNSQCSLREAVIAANTCEGENRIVLQHGTYELSLRGDGPAGGDLDITESVTIQGALRPAYSSIFGRGGWNERIFEIHAGTTRMSDLLIGYGNAVNGEGGGILNRGRLDLDNSQLLWNEAVSGGSLSNQGDAHLSNVDITTSRATYDYDIAWLEDTSSGIPGFPPEDVSEQCGGGIKNSGELLMDYVEVRGNDAAIGAGLCNTIEGDAHIYFSSFNHNGTGASSDDSEPLSIFGGGMANFNSRRAGTQLTLENSEVFRNQAVLGGGFYNMGTSWLDRVEIYQNRASRIPDVSGAGGDQSFLPSGGGIHHQAKSRLIVIRSVIRDNSSDYAGGGVTAMDVGSVSIIQSSIVNNTAQYTSAGFGVGGGLLIDGLGRVSLRNTTISGNMAGHTGGGIFLAGGQDLTLRQVTIADNTAAVGGSGLVQGGSSSAEVSLLHTLIGWHGGNACGLYQGFTFHAYNLAPAGTCLSGSGIVGSNFAATRSNDIRIDPLTSVAGQWVHPIPQISWAYDRVPVEVCADAVYDQDQLEKSRPIGAGCEVGAYEMPLEVMQSPLEEATPTAANRDDSDEPTVTTDSLCWHGPGPLYEVVSSLAAGTEVEILGRGVEGDWWVIDNPRFPGVPCWVEDDDLSVDPLIELEGLQIFTIPPLPTPTATPIQGCLYQGPNDNNATCYPIDQCPVDFEDSQGACTP